MGFLQEPTFKVLKTQGRARRGQLTSIHGSVETPAFFFCATKGTLKGLSVASIETAGTQILLSNTYHLMIQPGLEVLQDAGGLHAFMGWKKPIFTDSGGYQIFSLHHGSVSDEIKGRRRFKGATSPVRIGNEGAMFTSYRDGKRLSLTPESSVAFQCAIGVDWMCVLDECTPLHWSKKKTYYAMERSHAWELRSLEAFEKNKQPHQGLYGIVQGGVYPEFRQESIAFVTGQPFFGHAIGGSLGADAPQMYQVVRETLEKGLLDFRPIHLLGIGGLKDIFYGVLQGVDTFDCVSPTRLGRHGGALIAGNYWQDAWENFHQRSHINLWKSVFQKDFRPIDAACPCCTCRRYSRAYLHHLLKAGELLALSALSLHNVVFMNRYMEAIRQGIENNTLKLVAEKWLNLSVPQDSIEALEASVFNSLTSGLAIAEGGNA